MRCTNRVAVFATLLLTPFVSCNRDPSAPPEKGPGSVETRGDMAASDLALIDDYLRQWDQFAQGANELAASIREKQTVFESSLTRPLLAGDKRAPARMVFYPVVQIGGSINADSELGKAVAALVGDAVAVTTSDTGEPGFFAGHLYFWWLDEHEKFEAFPLFDEWQSREFAQTVAIPMYQGVARPE